jgi:hypothetical protein
MEQDVTLILNRKLFIPIRKIFRKYNFFHHLYRFIDRASGYQIEKYKFYKKRGYKLNLKKPTTFNEKIVWKKIYDRNPLLPVTSDKVMVRSYLKDRLGEVLASELLIPILYITENPETIPFESLPESYIIKVNHSSGRNIIVDHEKVIVESVVRNLKLWLNKTYGLNKNEWAYWTIPKKIIIEKLIKDEEGKIPTDYKYFVFHGSCKHILVQKNRFGDKETLHLDSDWNILDQNGNIRAHNKLERPLTYSKMVSIAEKLGEEFDFVRVDLYTVKDKIYFGELTHYPQSGLSPNMSYDLDFALGQYWDLDLQLKIE